MNIEKQDNTKISKIKISSGAEQDEDNKRLRQHLQEYLNLKESEIEKIILLKAKDLPKNYQAQREDFKDDRLNNATIAVIPDNLWEKGDQPSESDAENQLILINQEYYKAQENPDEIAWMTHELAHCQNFLNSETLENYEEKTQTLAFDDLKTKHTYLNNLVEQYAFTKQFQYLKEQNKSREGVIKMLSQYYHKDDFPFFDRLLDDVYSSK